MKKALFSVFTGVSLFLNLPISLFSQNQDFQGGTQDEHRCLLDMPIGLGSGSNPSGDVDLFSINPDWNKVTSWDTNDLNIYHVDMNHFRDTLFYVLNDPSKGKYFVSPVNGRVTSGFGRRRGGYHFGADIDLELGDPVRAAMEGVVRIASYNRGYGNMVVIAHEGGLETLYGHMSQLNVSEGQVVKAGHVIGLGGSTGRSTGPHLHLEVLVFGEQINPMSILSAETIDPIYPEVEITSNWFDYMLDLKKIKYHLVEENDNLIDIAMMYDKSPEHLAELNGILVESALEPGTKLLLE